MPQQRTTRRKPADEPAPHRPVARVCVDVSLAHLDRPFDYLVPARLDGAAVPGCRVRVSFAGQLRSGFLLERTATSAHEGPLTPLRRVVSSEPVLTGEIAGLARAVADRYAGTMSDVLRLAVPPRHARVESEAAGSPPAPPAAPEPGRWGAYPGGPAFLAELAGGNAPRAVWTALPGEDWPEAVACAVRATLSGGRGALVVVPDGRDVAEADAALVAALGKERHTVLAAGLGPAERYRRWLAVRRGAVRAALGTRAAAFAPVADLGLVAAWDDGDDLHAEPRAPYPHVREVLGLRAHRSGAAALFGGYARTCETTRLVALGWARPLAGERSRVRRASPRIRPAGEDAELSRDPAARGARLPSIAHHTAREGLRRGPVLVQVPRRGYLPVVACARCRHRPRCERCSGPLALTSAGDRPHCRWCGALAGAGASRQDRQDRQDRQGRQDWQGWQGWQGWHCPECGSPRVRAVTVGARRTAEELGRAFPSAPVRTSGRDAVLERVGPEPALVVSTPGAEPAADGGFAAALLLDGSALLTRPGLRAGEEALRRWLNAASLVRGAEHGGRVVVHADGALAPVQALLRWDPISYAEDELAERARLGFPPAVTMAALTGPREGLGQLLELAELPPEAEVLGPVPLEGRLGEQGRQRALVRAPRTSAFPLARALRDGAATRTARRSEGTVRVQVDPLEPL